MAVFQLVCTLILAGGIWTLISLSCSIVCMKLDDRQWLRIYKLAAALEQDVNSLSADASDEERQQLSARAIDLVAQGDLLYEKDKSRRFWLLSLPKHATTPTPHPHW